MAQRGLWMPVLPVRIERMDIMMNMYKQTIYISSIVGTMSFLLALIFWSQNTRWNDFFSNVCVGVFCSICIVIITVYIQYKSEFKRLFSNESSLLRELYISLMFLNETDVCSMSIEMRIDWVNKIEKNFSELIHNASEISCIEKKYKMDISKVVKDVMQMYMPFLENFKMYPGVALQMLKKPEYIGFICDDIKLAAKCKSDKNIAHIFVEQ